MRAESAAARPAPRSDAPWPRLLLLSDEAPNTGSAGGLLLHRLLRDYPADRLRVVATQVDRAALSLPCRHADFRPSWRRLERSRFNRWQRTARAWGLVPKVAVRDIDRVLEGFAPAVVMTVMQHAGCYDAAHEYARSRGLPLVVLVHDVNEAFEPVFPWALRAWRRRDAAFYRHATARLCISPEMEALCADLYGVRGDVLYPNRSEELTPRPFAESRELKRPDRLSVGFVGNLNYGYGRELLRLLPAFRAAAATLVAFGPAPGRDCDRLLEAADWFDYRGYVPAAQAWREVQSHCDAVILPYPHLPGHFERLYRHHFPSKLPDYLALGMPVIVTGPDYATGVRWAQRNPAAAVTWYSSEAGGIVPVLEALRNTPERRVALAEQAYAAGQRDFDPVAIRHTFLAHLLRAAGMPTAAWQVMRCA